MSELDFLSLPAPWRVSDNPSPDYGTEIFDATGKHILTAWISVGRPSEREQGRMTDAAWQEYCCDGHWESAVSFHLAHAIVALRNATDYAGNFPMDHARDLQRLMEIIGGRVDEQ